MQALYDVNLVSQMESHASSRPIEHRFNPYTMNGGYSSLSFSLADSPIAELFLILILILKRTIMAIAGEDYCIIASDSRQSDGYSINTRDAKKLHSL